MLANRPLGLVCAVLLAAAPRVLVAQDPVPAATLRGGLVGPVKLEVSLSDPGYATLIVVGRGAEANPVMVLAPRAPGDIERLKKEKWYAARPMRPADLLPFATMDSVALVMFTSPVRPVLANLANGEVWAAGLALPSAVTRDDDTLRDALARELYPNGEAHSVMIQMMSLSGDVRDGRLPACPQGEGVRKVPFVIVRTPDGARTSMPTRLELPQAPIAPLPTCDPDRKPADAKPK